MLLASAMFALMGSAVKFASEEGVTLAQLVLFRGLPSVVVLLAFARRAGRSIRPISWRMHVVRNIAGAGTMWLSFYALAHLPLATATSLTYTASLFIAVWMLALGGSQRDAVRILAVVLGFIGVIAMLRPSVSGDQWFAAGLGLVAGALSAVAMLQIRELGKIGEPEWLTVLIFSSVVSLSSLVGIGLEGWPSTGWQAYAALVMVGLFGLVGQLAMTRAFGVGSALLTAALQYSTIIFAALLGVGVWGERVDIWSWVGMGLIVSAGLLSVWRTLHESRRARI